MGLSEFDLIAAFRERLPGPGPQVAVGSGDDAAVVRGGGSHSVVSVDTTVDGVHARLELGDRIELASAFGWRALTTALSDLAAMGVDPAAGIQVYVALTLPRALPDDVVLAIADGLGDAARAYGASVVGGDVTAGPVVTASVTVIGWADSPASVLTRAGARPGDLVGLTGPIGASGAGLAVLLGDVDGEALPSLDAARLRDAYLRPRPSLKVGTALRSAGATAALDLSDGLLQDAGHLARASGVTVQLDPGTFPVAPGVDVVAMQLGEDPGWFAASAGEDYVLLVTVPPGLRAAAEAAGVVAWVGDVRAGEPVVDVIGDMVFERGGHDHRR